MNESVAAKLKQLAEELWWIQEFCQTILYNNYADSIRWQPVAGELESDMVKSIDTIHSIIYCLEVRKHIQQLGSHACWCFARIDDLVTHYTFQIRLRLRRPDLLKIRPTGEELKPNGWMEISQLAGWLSLLTGTGPLPTQQERADAANHIFTAVEREILEIVNDAGCLITSVNIHAARETDSDSKTTKTAVKKLVDEGFLDRPRGEKMGVALTIKGRLALRNTTKDSP
jgi:predicted transcriptional regulator